MKVIFLDFDGVITIPPKWSFNDNNIKWIKKIVDETGTKLVVSSSYRSGTPPNVQDTIKKTFIRAKSPNKMIQWLIDNIYDVTPYHIDDKYLDEIAQIKNDCTDIINENNRFGAVKYIDATLNDEFKGAIIFPLKTTHDVNHLEFICRDKLRDLLNLKDGDEVILEF